MTSSLDHPPLPFPWDIRRSLSVDLNERFDTSLFDEMDDWKVVASLRRCRNVIEETKSIKCIADVSSFQDFLIAGLHSSNSVVQFECNELFFEIRGCFKSVADPHDNSGFLTTDLSDVDLFYQACHFVGAVLLNDAMSMSFHWQMDCLHRFEKTNQMLSRITSDPRLLTKQDQSDLYMTPLAVMLGMILSVYRGCDFQSALTEALKVDLDLNHLILTTQVNPAFFLCHTSISPNTDAPSSRWI
ncbi:hypothetical protein BLNAU_21594 [Blattamonas nauphoetae]|uniref:Uncharacterized protein n=1 Tax=Blattamonas nauphoetae TaxID=2049346 RepID=A0ABQ9WVF9_9EUKA|nr:hypothetical protein BLNAU_21594 [Blattamonas nauphoetae]